MTKRNLSLSIALAGVLVLPSLTHAQNATPPAGGGPGERRGMLNPEERVKHMKETLGLSDDQATKLQAIFQKNADAAKALRDDTSLSQEDRRAKFGEMMKSTREEVDAVLTPEQKEKWKAEMEKRRGQHGPGGPGAPGAGGPGGHRKGGAGGNGAGGAK